MIVNIDEYREYLCNSGFRQNIEENLKLWGTNLDGWNTPPYFKEVKKTLQSLLLETIRKISGFKSPPQMNVDLATILKNIVGYGHNLPFSDPEYSTPNHSIGMLLQFYFQQYNLSSLNTDTLSLIVHETIYHLLQIECLSLTVLNTFSRTPYESLFQTIVNPLFYEIGGVEGGAAHLLTHSFFAKFRHKIHIEEQNRLLEYETVKNRTLIEQWEQETVSILAFMDLMEKAKQHTRQINIPLAYNQGNLNYPPNQNYNPQPPSDPYHYPQHPSQHPAYNPSFLPPPYDQTYTHTPPFSYNKQKANLPFAPSFDPPSSLSIPIPETLKEPEAAVSYPQSEQQPSLFPTPPAEEMLENEAGKIERPSHAEKIKQQKENFRKQKKISGERLSATYILKLLEESKSTLTLEYVEDLLFQNGIGIEILPNLISFLISKKTRSLFQEVIQKLCKNNPDHLFDFLRYEDPELVLAICEILKNIGPNQKTYNVLVELLSHQNFDIRQKVAGTLHHLFPKETTNLFITKLSDRDEKTRKLALENIPKTENKQVYFKVLSIIESAEFEAKELSEKRGLIYALAISGQKAALSKLKEFLDKKMVTRILRKEAMNKQMELKKCAIRALGSIEDTQAEVLIEQMKQSKHSELSLIAKIAGSEREKLIKERQNKS